MQIRIATRRFRHRDVQRNTVRVMDASFDATWHTNMKMKAERSCNRSDYHRKEITTKLIPKIIFG